MTSIKERLAYFISEGKGESACPWRMSDVLAITILIFVFIFSDPFNAGANILKSLRLHFFIFTKEPKLYYYLTIYISNIIFKCLSFVYVVVIIKSRHISFRDSVLTTGSIPKEWRFWLPVYLCVCVLIRMMSMSNPLVPNIPFTSVFPGAFYVGNIVVILSIILVAPLVEEILFRGFLYPALNYHMGRWPSIIITSVLFTFAHYTQVKNDYVFAVVIFLLSVVITYAKAKTGSTWLAIIMHFIYNAVSVGMGILNYCFLRY
ncbi:MAG: CPBP family intramembrane metalloprotease [Candidatus Tantalella remota]|nr:CPBP family intramembrane metalloprotease [Candidatus Tantalella remota]